MHYNDVVGLFDVFVFYVHFSDVLWSTLENIDLYVYRLYCLYNEMLNRRWNNAFNK